MATLVRKMLGDTVLPGEEDHPTWQSISEAIVLLDGKTLSGLTLIIDDDKLMGTAGGGDNYMVSVLLANRWHALTNPAAVPGQVTFIGGGQSVTCPRAEVVDLDTALQAANLCACEGVLDPWLDWK